VEDNQICYAFFDATMVIVVYKGIIAMSDRDDLVNKEQMQALKNVCDHLKCNNEYVIRGGIDCKAMIHEEIWKIETLLYRSRVGGASKNKIKIDDEGKAQKLPKNDYGYIEIEKLRQALIFAIEALLKQYGWQNVLVVNSLAKYAITILRTFFGKMKKEFVKFERKCPKIQEEADKLESKIAGVVKAVPTSNDLQMIMSFSLSMCSTIPFNHNGKIKHISFEEENKKKMIYGETTWECANLIEEVNFNNHLLELFASTCERQGYFEIIKDFFAGQIDKDKSLNRVDEENVDEWKMKAQTGRLADFRDAVVHTNEIQIAVNMELLPYFFNDAKFLYKHITFIKRETLVPIFAQYEFALSET